MLRWSSRSRDSSRRPLRIPPSPLLPGPALDAPVDLDGGASAQGGGEFASITHESARNVRELGERLEFGLVVHDDTLVVFPDGGPPARATRETQQQAVSLLAASIGGRFASCVTDAISAALRMAAESHAERTAMIYAGTARGFCGEEAEASYLAEALERLATENREGIPIHTFEFFGDPLAATRFLPAARVDDDLDLGTGSCRNRLACGTPCPGHRRCAS